MTAKDVGSGALFGAAGTLTTEYPRRKRRTIAVILLRSVRLSLVAEVFGGGYLRSTLPRSSFLCFFQALASERDPRISADTGSELFLELGGRIEQSNSRRHFASRGIVRFLGQLLLKVRVLELLPNVKDEPRPQRARLVLRIGNQSVASFRTKVRKHEA